MYHLCNWCVPRPLLGHVVDKKGFASSRINILQPPALHSVLATTTSTSCYQASRRHTRTHTHTYTHTHSLSYARTLSRQHSQPLLLVYTLSHTDTHPPTHPPTRTHTHRQSNRFASRCRWDIFFALECCPIFRFQLKRNAFTESFQRDCLASRHLCMRTRAFMQNRERCTCLSPVSKH